MESQYHFKNNNLLPSFLLNDIEFDELDKELESIENIEANGSIIEK